MEKGSLSTLGSLSSGREKYLYSLLSTRRVFWSLEKGLGFEENFLDISLYIRFIIIIHLFDRMEKNNAILNSFFD